MMYPRKNMFWVWLVYMVAVTGYGSAASVMAANQQIQPVTTHISDNKHALLPVIVSSGASARVKAAAATLADYLGRISGTKFEIKEGNGRSGLAVGIPAHFPVLPFDTTFDPKDSTQREDYVLRSHAAGVYLIGATELAVEHAVWDFLYRLGYRQFFPGPHWEIVPRTPHLSITVDVREHPDYYARSIWFGYGTWPENARAYNQWRVRNRVTSGIRLNTGHAYGGIIEANKKEFDMHPEYLVLSEGERQPGPNTKFRISNHGLRQLVVEHALRYFNQHPEADSISVEPSDGGGWCKSAECAQMGRVSDRVVTLANQVAEAVNQRFHGKFVGFYAYNYHSPPPSIRMHPRVVVSVATAFIRGSYSVDQLIDGWKKQGATIGIREYYSVIKWSHDLPGTTRAANIDYLKATIPKFHAKGARFLSAESGDSWGPNGLGYYVAARLLWNVQEADRVDAIVHDLLDKSFGSAREPMERFYRLLTGVKNNPRHLISGDYLSRLYRALDAALQRTDEPAICARIGDLVLYVRFVELFQIYRAARGSGRQQAFEELLRFSYRIRATHMIHSFGLYRTEGSDESVKVPVEAKWNVPEKDKKGQPLNPWKNSTPFEPHEIQQFVRTGIERNQSDHGVRKESHRERPGKVR